MQTVRGLLPDFSRAGIWSCLFAFIMQRLVDGICRIEKWSPAGRVVLLTDVNTVSAHLLASIKLRCA